jgi:DNA-binding transcriptional MerR regulator
MTPRSMSIKALARAAGETVETVCLCEREGLLRPSAKQGYDEAALAVLCLVRLGQKLRIPLEEIKAATVSMGSDANLNAVMRSWALKRIACIAREQEDLQFAQSVLCDFLARSQATEPAASGRALLDLARLHRDLIASPEVVPAPKAPRPRRAARGPVEGAPRRNSAVPPLSVREEMEREAVARFAL